MTQSLQSDRVWPTRSVVIELENDNLVLNCDRQLILMLLNQYIDNACKYSNAGTADYDSSR
jgi:K+-sensing histidine kinase KdpD